MTNSKVRKRFKIYHKESVKTGLSFDFHPRIINYDNNENVISILEDDLFTIEPVLYKSIENYQNYGHWGRHELRDHSIKELLIELDTYILHLKTNREREYCLFLNEKNFGTIYNDINSNRKQVIRLASGLRRWISANAQDILTISGI